jgi:drug/metabolite transporter (DMT)-like permease
MALFKQNNTLGIILSLAGYTAWVGADALVKLAGATLPMLEILWIDFFVGALFTLLAASIHGGVRQVYTKRFGFHLWRSLFLMGNAYGSVAGVIYLSLADFYTIIFTSPLLLTALGSLFLAEKVDLKMWLAIIFGFLGVVVAVQFSGLNGCTLSWMGILVTTVASLSLAVTMLTARAAGTENNYSLTLWPQVINAIVSFLLMLTLVKFVASPIGMFYAALSGVFGGIGLILTNASLRVAPVAVVSPYHYTQIVGGALVGYLIWKDVPTAAMIVGAIMIIASGAYVFYAEQKRVAA